MQIKTTSHDSEIAVGNGVYTVEYTFSTGESIVKVRMIANVSFREIVILSSRMSLSSVPWHL